MTVKLQVIGKHENVTYRLMQDSKSIKVVAIDEDMGCLIDSRKVSKRKHPADQVNDCLHEVVNIRRMQLIFRGEKPGMDLFPQDVFRSMDQKIYRFFTEQTQAA